MFMTLRKVINIPGIVQTIEYFLCSMDVNTTNTIRGLNNKCMDAMY